MRKCFSFALTFWLGTSCLLTAFAALAQSNEAPSITPRELHQRREAGKAPLAIDVRTAEEFAAGHIPGAVHIPYDQVAKRIADVEAPHGVAVYCMVGPRARKGEQALLESGYEPVFHLEGGFSAWQAGGLPVEKGR
jgi:rhodanese-related sulfurtransferase